MKESHGSGWVHATVWIRIVALVWLVASVGAGRAEAAAIHPRRADVRLRESAAEYVAQQVQLRHERFAYRAALLADSRSWSRYLLGGPSVWGAIVHPPVSPAVEAAIWKAIRTDPGGTAPFVDYLLWKQARDPARFAYYHPRLAPILTQMRSPVITPSVAPTPPPSTPLVEPQQVPEPTGILVGLMLAGFARVWLARKRAS